jgi:glycine/D-amino acid oxidase-like deaminating enzyme
VKPSYDIVIVGAGIVGAACACEFAQAGFRVAIVEAGIPAGAATAAGMGHIVVMDDSPAQLALTAYARSLWRSLAPQLPKATEFHTTGTLWVAADEEEMREVHAKSAVYGSVGIESTILDAQSLASAEPNLRAGLAGGLLVPQDAVLYPPTAAAYFMNVATQLGATLVTGQAATRLESGCVNLANGSSLNAAYIVVATGVHTDLVPGVTIHKRKGHLLITDRYPDFVHHQLVELGYLKSAHTHSTESVAFNVQPRSTGQLLIGSSRQFGAESPAIEHRILRQMLDRATSYMPRLAGLAGIRAWTGFRAATPDKLPLIGPSPDPTGNSKIWLAMGFEGLGITNAPAVARILADGVLGRSSAIDPMPYLPSRLAAAEVAHA